jgi:glycosyltransferase involved in cell wall biosynthesis
MTDSPRVFHLITRLLKGGAEAKTIETVQGLDEYDFTVGHGAEFDPDQVARLESNGVETRCFRTIRHYNPVTALPAVVAVARYLSRKEFDILHTHSTEAGIIGRFAASIADVPAVVHTVHGVPFAEDRNALLNQFVLRCERAAARRTDRIVTNADAIAEAYLDRKIGHTDQYTTVYSGIDIDRFRNASPADDIDGSSVRILMVSRLANGKGFKDLFDALEQIEEEVSVYLVGDGPLFEELEKTIEGRDLPVSMLGYRSDVASVMAACDIFVLPSYREGTPRVITEAMASGLPVVSTEIAGIPEQVADGKNGFLIQPGDIEALADRLTKLVESTELREGFGMLSQERIEKFSVETMLSGLDDLYQELLASDR